MIKFHFSMISDQCSLKTELSWRIKPEIVKTFEEVR